MFWRFIFFISHYKEQGEREVPKEDDFLRVKFEKTESAWSYRIIFTRQKYKEEDD